MTEQQVVGHPATEQAPQLYRITLTVVTSVVVVTMRRTAATVGTVDELERLCRRTRARNLAGGWWGFPFGPAWTIVALVRNRRALAQLRAIAHAA